MLRYGSRYGYGQATWCGGTDTFRYSGYSLHPRPEWRGTTRDLLRAVLRPRLRLRGDPDIPPPAGGSELDRRGAGGLLPRRRLLGLELHDLDGQLVRPGDGAGPTRPDLRDASQLPDGRGDPRRLRRPRPALRGQLHSVADRSKHVRRMGDPAGGVQRELPADSCLERPFSPTVGGWRDTVR